MSTGDPLTMLLKPSGGRIAVRQRPIVRQPVGVGDRVGDVPSALRWDSTRPLRIAIADQSALFRDGVVAALGSRTIFTCIGQVSNQADCLELTRAVEPAIAVVELDLPGQDAIPLARQIVDEGLATRLLILSACANVERGYAAVQAGARGCLTKAADREELCSAILAIARGNVALAPEIQSWLVDHVDQSCPPSVGISPRDTEILHGVAAGMSNGQIARHLLISQATVKMQLQSLFEHFGVSDRTAAAVEAVRRGLVP